MQTMGLNRAELKAYHRALRDHATIRITVAVLNLEGDTIASLRPKFLSGQVVVQRPKRADVRTQVARVLTMQFLDPNHALNFDTDSPGDGVLYRDRQLRVYYAVRVPELGRYVTAVPFTGPVVEFQRTGDVVDVTAHSGERQAMGNLGRGLTIKKGTKKTDAIRLLLEETGESRFHIPDLSSRLPRRLSMGQFAVPWVRAKRLASSEDQQLFYNGRGVPVMRELPDTVLFTFNDGENGVLTSDVATSTNMERLRNKIIVRGGKPKGQKRRVRGVAVAPPEHKMSAQSLGRKAADGERKPHWLIEVIENDHLRSNKACDRKAKRILEDRLRSVTDVAFDSVPIPHLDEGDLVRVATDDGFVTFRLDSFVLPLHTEGSPPMKVNYIENTDPKARRIRRR